MISRRNFFKALIAGSAFYPFKKVFASKNIENDLPLPFISREGKQEFPNEKILNMYNVHTDERLNITYCSSGVYDRDAIDKINYFLRCHYTNEVKEIDVSLLDLLCDIHDVVGKDREVQIISGYRSTLYNKFLISQGRNVSRNSFHLQGLAIDFAVEGISNDRLSKIAKSFSAGGVGKYPEFIHIDVGRVRYW